MASAHPEKARAAVKNSERDRELDEALKMTFPGSDPVAVYEPRRTPPGKEALNAPVPPTALRVEANTPAEINARIKRETEARVRKLAGDPAGIAARLRQLDREWDIERALEANAAAFAFTGAAMSILGRRRWALLPVVVGGFLMQHAVQGWCPPLPVLRRMGFRTPREIEIERNALKALRGDYDKANTVDDDGLSAIEGARR